MKISVMARFDVPKKEIQGNVYFSFSWNGREIGNGIIYKDASKSSK